MVRHIRSWLLPLLEAACPTVSRHLLLAVRRRASLRLHAVCASLSTPVGDQRVLHAGGPLLKLLPCASHWQRMRVPVDGWISKLFSSDRSSKHWQTDPRKSAKNCPIFGKAYMFKEESQLGRGFERQGLVCFLELDLGDFDDPGMEDLINEESWVRISGTRRAKSMSEDAPGYVHGQ